MEREVLQWESELWLYLSNGDGTDCPLSSQCQPRQKVTACLSDETGKETLTRIQKFIDDDEIDLTNARWIDLEFPGCLEISRIFKLVNKLARKYREKSWDNRLPVPDNLILVADDNCPIEVRRVPLKVCHGAIWRLSDRWVIHLNSYDTPARQRFTLYHEIFHILAHSNAASSLDEGTDREGLFNEILADHFAANILLPHASVVARWAEIKDVSRMAAIFQVPESVMHLGLGCTGLL